MAKSFFKGNTRQLNKLIDSLKSLESVAEKAAERTVPVIEKLLEREFIYTRSPNGRKWAPLKRDTGRPPLDGLKDYFIVTNHKNTVYVGHEKPYAKFHQTGTRFMKARKMLPEKDLSKSKTWTNKINSTLNKLFKDIFKKGAA
jgi:phage gpG-like protein